MEGSKKLKTVRLPTTLAYGLIHRGCSPADLAAHAINGGDKPKLEAFRFPAAPAYGLIRRGYSPANLPDARYAMAARWAQPAAGKGWRAQQTKASGPGDQARPSTAGCINITISG